MRPGSQSEPEPLQVPRKERHKSHSEIEPMRSKRPLQTSLASGVLLLTLTGIHALDKPVADAAEKGDIETVRQLLRDGADVNASQGDGMTALHWAALRGDTELGTLLIYAGSNVDSGTRIGHYTPLHIASRAGHVGIVKVLLEARSDPNAATTNSGATPLHLAATAGRPDVVAALWEAGAELDAREAAWGQTPLIFAAANGRTDAIKVLLAAGANPGVSARTVDVAEREKADRAAEKRLSEFLADFKKKEGGGTDWRPAPSQVQAAIEASREIQRRWPDVPLPGQDDKKESEKKVDSATESGDGRKEGDEKESGPSEGDKVDAVSDKAEVKTSAPDGRKQPESAAPVNYNADGQPVYDNVRQGRAEDDNEPRPLSYGELVGSWGGLTPLLHSVRQGHIEATLALLEGGADIDQPSAGDQTTPLLMAAINGQFDLALVLIDRGADPNLTSAAGTTPLFAVLERTWAPKASYAHPVEHRQQQATHIEVVEALLKARADPNVRLKHHLWYMEYTFSVLRRAGINLKGATPFWRAAQALDVDAMRLLKEYGADPSLPTIKPPQRRRRRGQTAKKKTPAAEKNPDQPVEATEEPRESLDEDEVQNPKKANAEGESAEGEGEGNGEGRDHSGIPPVPVGGPYISPIHAAAGAGYGQYFAGNAHRHVPGNWLAAVRFLVEECDADVNIRDANAYTALHHAASRGDNALILYLVEKGADVTVVSRKGETTADMANGPIQRLSPFPETIALLEQLGSKNNHRCVSC